MYLGDYTEDYSDLNFKFTTRDSTGQPVAMSGNPSLYIYKSNSTSYSLAGLTLTNDFNSQTGLHHAKIDLSSDSFYEKQKDYSIVVGSGLVDGINVAGETVGHFSIENRNKDVKSIDGNFQAVSGLKEAGIDYDTDSRFNANIVSIYGNAGAADDLKQIFTGGAGTTLTIDSLVINDNATVSGNKILDESDIPLNTNVVSISGSNDAAHHQKIILDDDFSDNYNSIVGLYKSDLTRLLGSSNGPTSLNTIFVTDINDNYDSVNNRWTVDIIAAHGSENYGLGLAAMGQDYDDVGFIAANAKYIGASKPAADNLKSAFTGTGYSDINAPVTRDFVQNSGVKLSVTEDVYHADIEFTRDQNNTQDEYTVTWFKNGQRVNSGISSAHINVVKRADGTDLVPSTEMTQIGSTGSYKYDEGSNRLALGEAALVITSGNIDNNTRAFSRLVSRDSI